MHLFVGRESLRLWTTQTERVWELLQEHGRFRAKWRQNSTPSWKAAYLWMAKEMVRRAYQRRPIAPIWAWHSCNALNCGPDQKVIEDLHGYGGPNLILLEVEAPDHLALLSGYGDWNDVLDEFIIAQGENRSVDPVARNYSRIFDVSLNRIGPWEANSNDIQACLPHLDLTWVRSTKPIEIPPVDPWWAAKARKDTQIPPNSKLE